jgi:hypothetical protein
MLAFIAARSRRRLSEYLRRDDSQLLQDYYIHREAAKYCLSRRIAHEFVQGGERQAGAEDVSCWTAIYTAISTQVLKKRSKIVQETLDMRP